MTVHGILILYTHYYVHQIMAAEVVGRVCLAVLQCISPFTDPNE